MGDKVAARQSAIAAGLPVVPGTETAVSNAEEAEEFCLKHGVPVIFKVSENVFKMFQIIICKLFMQRLLTVAAVVG